MIEDAKVTISWGELLDRHTIATVRWERRGGLADPSESLVAGPAYEAAKLIYDSHRQLANLFQCVEPYELALLLIHWCELLKINRRLWDLEDEVRRTSNDHDLLAAAKQIFALNQDRNNVKVRIGSHFTSSVTEPPKEYK